jgi:hypothetical protein
MTDFDADAADLRARWDAASQSGSLRPTAEEQSAMREHILAAIAAVPAPSIERTLAPARQDPRHHRRRWAFAASLAAAAVLVMSVMLRHDASDGTGGSLSSATTGPSVAAGTASDATLADSLLGAFDTAHSAPMRTALQLASREASPEFAALDAAASELDTALAQNPDDPELRAFRAALDARRDELAQRIKRVTE